MVTGRSIRGPLSWVERGADNATAAAMPRGAAARRTRAARKGWRNRIEDGRECGLAASDACNGDAAPSDCRVSPEAPDIVDQPRPPGRSSTAERCSGAHGNHLPNASPARQRPRPPHDFGPRRGENHPRQRRLRLSCSPPGARTRRDRRGTTVHTRRQGAVLLLAFAALLGSHGTAQAQTDVWSATLTVGTETATGVTFLGWNDSGTFTGASLSDQDFTYDSESYNLDAI